MPVHNTGDGVLNATAPHQGQPAGDREPQHGLAEEGKGGDVDDQHAHEHEPQSPTLDEPRPRRL